MKKLARYVIAILCIALLISGCGSDESQSASTQLPGGGQSPAANASSSMPQASQQQDESGGKMIEPKQLISKEEAAQLLGEAVKDAMTDEKQVLGMKICFYAAENSASKGYLQIALIQSGMLQQGQQQSSSPGGSGQQSGGSGQQSGGSGQQSGGSGGGENSPQPSQSGSSGEQLSPKSIYEALKQSMEDLNSADTGRIGDDNFLSAQGMGILSGEYFIFVSAGSNDPAALPGIVKSAGEMAVLNLKRIQGQ